MRHRAGRTILIFIFVWTALFAQSARAQLSVAKPDLSKLADEAQGWLSDLVKINTVNPPGNEAAVAKYISAIFQKEGISNEVLEMAPGRSVVVARLQAGPLPDPAGAGHDRAPPTPVVVRDSDPLEAAAAIRAMSSATSLLEASQPIG